MSATIKVGLFEVSSHALYDPDEGLWYVKAGVKSREGNLILHLTTWGLSPEVARNRAETYCTWMTAINLNPDAE